MMAALVIPKLVVQAAGGNRRLAEHLWEQPFSSLWGQTPAQVWSGNKDEPLHLVVLRCRVLNAIKSKLLTSAPVTGPTNGSGKPLESLLVSDIRRRKRGHNRRTSSMYRL